SWIAFHCDPAKRMGGPVDEECTRRALYVRNALRRLEGHGVQHIGGGMSHRDVVRLLCESEVFAYPCEPFAFTETFSCSTLEACAAGCATIISSADCLDEVHGHAAAHDWRKLAGDLEKLIEEWIERKKVETHVGAWTDAARAAGYHAEVYRSPATSLEKPRIDLVLTKYGSGEEPIDIDRPFDSNSGGGCRAGFMGLVRGLPKLGDDVRAGSNFRDDHGRDGVWQTVRDGITYSRLAHTTGLSHFWQSGQPLPFEPRNV